MNKTILLIHFFSLCMCTNVQDIDTHNPNALNEQIAYSLSTIEYHIYTLQLKRASFETRELCGTIQTHKEKSKPKTYSQYHNLADELLEYAPEIIVCDIDWSLDRLRQIKTLFIESCNDKESYSPLFYLWKLEEEMYYTVKTAKDPKLGLYNWNEFEWMLESFKDVADNVLYNKSFEIEDIQSPISRESGNLKRKLLLNSVQSFYDYAKKYACADEGLIKRADQVTKDYLDLLKHLLLHKSRTDSQFALI